MQTIAETGQTDEFEHSHKTIDGWLKAQRTPDFSTWWTRIILIRFIPQKSFWIK